MRESENRENAKRGRPRICWIAILSGVALSFTASVAALRTGAHIETLGDLVFGFLFSLWVGMPLMVLGQLKVFRESPTVVFVLWLLGLSISSKMLFDTFVAPSSSTTALGMLTTPFYLIVIYSFIGAIEFFRKRSSAHLPKSEG